VNNPARSRRLSLIGSYGFQTPTKLRMVLSVALVDAMIKDADIVAVRPIGPLRVVYHAHAQIFRAVHHLLLAAIHNPFLSLPSSFRAEHATPAAETTTGSADSPAIREQRRIHNQPVQTEQMFKTNPDEIQGEWLKESLRFQSGMKRIGELLSGGRA